MIRQCRIQNRKWAGFFAIAVTLMVCGARAEAQQPKKVARIGYIGGSSGSSSSASRKAFRQGLRDLGYVEGKNIVIEYRHAEEKLDRLPGLASELVRLKVDAIVTCGPTVTRAVKEASVPIPIIMVQDPDPVENGFVASLARPGGNITGLSSLTANLSGKRLALLRETVPKLAHVAVFYDPAIPPNVVDVQEILPVAARAFGLTIQPCEVRDTDDFERVFAALNKERPDGLYVSGGTHNARERKTDRGLCVKEQVTFGVLQQRC